MPRRPSTILISVCLASYAVSDPNHPHIQHHLAATHAILCVFHHYHPHHTDVLSPDAVPSFVMYMYQHYTDIFCFSSRAYSSLPYHTNSVTNKSLLGGAWQCWVNTLARLLADYYRIFNTNLEGHQIQKNLDETMWRNQIRGHRK